MPENPSAHEKGPPRVNSCSEPKISIAGFSYTPLTNATPSPNGESVVDSTVAGASYGINWAGGNLASDLLGPVTSSWPMVRVRQVQTPEPLAPPITSDDEMGVRLASGGFIQMRRRAEEAIYVVPVELGSEELVHPYLAPTAWAFSVWFGREAYHAGAFALDGGAFAVVGEREGGKSTTLAWLAAEGRQVLSDDLLVLQGRSVLPGPRCIDLREASAGRLGVGNPLPSVRSGGRWRLRLAPADPLPLRGWIFLVWGDTIEVRPLRPSERLDLILRLGRPADPTAPLTLAEVPAWAFIRPKTWQSLARCLDRLFDVVSG